MKVLILVLLVGSSAFADKVPTQVFVNLDWEASEKIFESLATQQEPIKEGRVHKITLPGIMTCRGWESFSDGKVYIYGCTLDKGAWVSDEEGAKSGIGYFEPVKKEDAKRLYEALGEAQYSKSVCSGEDCSTLHLYSKKYANCRNAREPVAQLTQLEATFVQVENFGRIDNTDYRVEVRNHVKSSPWLCPQ